jgi:hypothetical protein
MMTVSTMAKPTLLVAQSKLASTPSIPIPFPFVSSSIGEDAVSHGATGKGNDQVRFELMGMSTCDGTDMVPPNARSHAVSMAGTVVGDVDVFIRLQFGMSADQNVAMKLSVRAEDPAFCECIHSIIQQA